MKSILKSLVAAAVVVGLTGTAMAKPGGGGKGHSGGSVSQKPASTVVQQATQQSFKSAAKNIQVNKTNIQSQKFDFSKSSKTVLNKTYTGKDYHMKFGKKCDFGFCYYGKNHCHWDHCCWCAPCSCYFNYCPCSCCYYWWCVEDLCWYPYGFCPVAYKLVYNFGW